VKKPKNMITGVEQNGHSTFNMDVVCFSHLRWNFVFQRPQHLLTRVARSSRVFYIEEPVIHAAPSQLLIEEHERVLRVVPHVSAEAESSTQEEIKKLINDLFEEYEIKNYALWFYTPMALDYTRHLSPSLVIYDCMDELSAFKGAPKEMRDNEDVLLRQADIVFTGGESLYEVRRDRHPNVMCFPSSIDVEHFKIARDAQEVPADQSGIPEPRIGFFGVIDERMDLDLIEGIAEARPDWHLVLIGPVAKIDKSKLPKQSNIHYLGMKDYKELPAYLGGWQAAILPFAQNESTRFISPTKTPEYLAGGKPVVSTPIRDVIRPYGKEGLVWIASGVDQFVKALEAALALEGKERLQWLRKVDDSLAGNSWDNTWDEMSRSIMEILSSRQQPPDDILTSRMGSASSLTFNGQPVQKTSTAGNGSRKHKIYDYLVVGAGFAGSVLAERLARGSGKKVLLIDKRSHIAGNAYDHYDDSGVLVHKYGPHIFHTNSGEVFAYLSKFTKWRPYEHRVLASVDGQLLPMPINLDTINRLYGLNLSSFDLDDFFASVAEPVENIKTSEDVVVSRVGRQIYEKFFRNYTRKQWDLDPSELDASVTSRVPIRNNRDDRYFTDVYQAMPKHGYTRMFENLLDHPNIHVMLNTDYRDVVDYLSYNHLIYTGPVDEYFDYRYGKLPYRSIKFQFQTYEQELRQQVAVINYPNEHAYTRVTEFKHLTGQVHPHTSVVYEYPCSEGDPYYPIPRKENADQYQKYKKLAEATKGVTFAGRLGTYRYYNMDQVTAQALNLYARLTGKPRKEAAEAVNKQSSIQMPCSLLIAPE
jgi:UDP-galactopyranose mutase